MKTIGIEVNGDAIVSIDGTPLSTILAFQAKQAQLVAGAAPEEVEESLRHDTPLEVSIAATCHEANRQYARTLGDFSVKPWSQCPGWMQATNIAGVRAILEGRVRTPAESHADWMAEKLDQGWRYGPDKSEVHKTHPNLVPYAQLAPEQRKKDLIFFTLATALLSAS